MNPFRKISAKEESFLKTKDKNIKLYEDFKHFNALETLKSSKSKKKVSGRASSYSNYLIRLIIIYEKVNSIIHDDYFSLDTYYRMYETFSDHLFTLYNKEEFGYPNATLNSYFKFSKQYENYS